MAQYSEHHADDQHHADDRDLNQDPITGEPGAHPVGAGLGAAAGGAAAGAAVGAVAGPIGAAVGIVAGGLAGGLAGKAIAEQVDPTAEEQYWRDEYPKRDYYDENVEFDEMAPAYQHGWESRTKHHDRNWDDVEPELERQWDRDRGDSSLDWQQERPATRDAWERVDLIVLTEVDDDARKETANQRMQEQQTPRKPK